MVATDTICTLVTLNMSSNVSNSNPLAFEYLLPFPLLIYNSLSTTEQMSFISNYSPVYFKYTESLGVKILSFLKSNKANTYSIVKCIAYMYKWSFIDLAYTAGARYLHSGKRGPDICSV